MKKLFLALCVAVGLLFSVAVTPVRADEGNGHDIGYVCVESETVDCPPQSDALPQQQQSETSGSNTEAAEEDTSLTLLELVITLILNG